MGGKTSRDRLFSVCGEEYKQLGQIGSGAFSEIFLVQHQNTRQLRAISRIHKVSLLREISAAETTLQSLEVAIALQGAPYLLPIYAAFQDESFLYLLMKLCAGGELRSRMVSGDVFVRFDEDLIRSILAELVVGIEAMHARGVVHRDIKPENILIDNEGRVLIADFGLAVLCEGPRPLEIANRNRSVVGTLAYIAPELLLRGPHSEKVDWWSLGVLAYQMAHARKPWPLPNREECESFTDACRIYLRSQASKPLVFSREVSVHFISLVHKLLTPYPQQRFDYERIKKHPFFHGVDWNDVQQRRDPAPFAATNATTLQMRLRELAIANSSPFDLPTSPLPLPKQQLFAHWDWLNGADIGKLADGVEASIVRKEIASLYNPPSFDVYPLRVYSSIDRHESTQHTIFSLIDLPVKVPHWTQKGTYLKKIGEKKVRIGSVVKEDRSNATYSIGSSNSSLIFTPSRLAMPMRPVASNSSLWANSPHQRKRLIDPESIRPPSLTHSLSSLSSSPSLPKMAPVSSSSSPSQRGISPKLRPSTMIDAVDYLKKAFAYDSIEDSEPENSSDRFDAPSLANLPPSNEIYAEIGVEESESYESDVSESYSGAAELTNLKLSGVRKVIDPIGPASPAPLLTRASTQPPSAPPTPSSARRTNAPSLVPLLLAQLPLQSQRRLMSFFGERPPGVLEETLSSSQNHPVLAGLGTSSTSSKLQRRHSSSHLSSQGMTTSGASSSRSTDLPVLKELSPMAASTSESFSRNVASSSVLESSGEKAAPYTPQEVSTSPKAAKSGHFAIPKIETVALRPRSRSSPRLYAGQVKSKGSMKIVDKSKKGKEKEKREKIKYIKSHVEGAPIDKEKKMNKGKKFASEGQIHRGALMYSPRVARAASESAASEIDSGKSIERTPPKSMAAISHQSRHVHVNKLKKVLGATTGAELAVMETAPMWLLPERRSGRDLPRFAQEFSVFEYIENVAQTLDAAFEGEDEVLEKTLATYSYRQGSSIRDELSALTLELARMTAKLKGAVLDEHLVIREALIHSEVYKEEYIRREDHEDLLFAYETDLKEALKGKRRNRGHQTERDVIRDAEKKLKGQHETHVRRKTFSGSIEDTAESRYLTPLPRRKRKARKSPKRPSSRNFVSEGSYFETVETDFVPELPDMAAVKNARRVKRRENLIRQNSRALLNRVKSISKRPKKEKKKKATMVDPYKTTSNSDSDSEKQ